MLHKQNTTRKGRAALGTLLSLAVCVSAHAQNPREIVTKALQSDHDMLAVAAQYTYQEHQITKELDAGGRATKTTSEVRDVLFLGGKRYEHLLERNGKPLPDAEAREEKEKLDKAAAEAGRLSQAERDRRFAEFVRQRAKQREALAGVPDAYRFTLLGTEAVGGRPCYLIAAEPRSDYNGKNSNILRHMNGRLWIDKERTEWLRLEANVLDDVSFGFFLAKLSKGAHFNLQRTRVNNEVWLPKEVDMKLSARALVKNIRVEQVVTYTDYRKYSAESRVVAEGAPK